MRARAALVLLKRFDQIRLVLSGDLRHAIDLGIRGAPTGNAVAALAHLNLLAADLGIAGRAGLSERRRRYGECGDTGSKSFQAGHRNEAESIGRELLSANGQ